MKILIVGCGYVGMRLAPILPRDWDVYALTRSAGRIEELEACGVRPAVGDWQDPQSLARLKALSPFDRVIVSVPHREANELGVATHARGLQNVADYVHVDRWIYLSTTGVYGGEERIVNEDAPVNPSRVGGHIACQGEQWLAQARVHHTVIRLAGIYGVGRIPLADRLRAGEPLTVPQDGFLNLVHVEDIAQMIAWILSHEPRRNTYVFSDGCPVLRVDFYRYLAQLCGIGEPRFEQADETDSRQRRAGSKRVDPSRLVSESSYTFLFPTYREGLANALGFALPE